ncbi:MAG: hypothetical protein Q9227_002774 [Pyrenula ochraceoflavens]
MRFLLLALACFPSIYAADIGSRFESQAAANVARAAVSDADKLKIINNCITVTSTNPSKVQSEVEDCLQQNGMSLDDASKLGCSGKRRRKRNTSKRFGKRLVNEAVKFLKRHDESVRPRELKSGEKPTRTVNNPARRQVSAVASPSGSGDTLMTDLGNSKPVGSVSDVPEKGGSKSYAMQITCDETVPPVYFRNDFLSNNKDQLCSAIGNNLKDLISDMQKFMSNAPLKNLLADPARATGDAYQNVQVDNLSGLAPVMKVPNTGSHIYVKTGTLNADDPSTWANKICSAAIDQLTNKDNPCVKGVPLSGSSNAGENYAQLSGIIEFTSDGKAPNFDNTNECTNCVATVGVIVPDTGMEEDYMLSEKELQDGAGPTPSGTGAGTWSSDECETEDPVESGTQRMLARDGMWSFTD